MAKSTAQAEESQKFSEDAFERFLGWLDDGFASDGESYLVMRKRLVAYFDRKNCKNPEDLADDTLARVARRLEEEGEIRAEAPAQYCYIVARFVFLEHLRNKETASVSLDAPLVSRTTHAIAAPEPGPESDLKEKLLDCLDKCTAELGHENQEMIIRYYHGTQRAKINNRRSIAARIGISMNALSIRMCRMRDKLEACVKKCAD